MVILSVQCCRQCGSAHRALYIYGQLNGSSFYPAQLLWRLIGKFFDGKGALHVTVLAGYFMQNLFLFSEVPLFTFISMSFIVSVV